MTIILVLFGLSVQAQSDRLNKLTRDAEVSLLTIGPGSDLYTVFGHSAIRVKDDKLGIDAVFNYGTFQFSDDFYLQFTLGKLNYMISAGSFKSFLQGYIFENRTVIEQVLNLNRGEKQAFWDYLRVNLEPENRFYLYDFFYNNCSTKIRDAAEDILGEELQFDNDIAEYDLSFRNKLDVYLHKEMDWSDFGIDLALGLPCDVKPQHRELMFLPDELMLAFDHATLRNKPLVKSTNLMYEQVPQTNRFPWWMRPISLTLLILIISIVVTFMERSRNKSYFGFDRFLFGFMGLFGFFLAFLWFGTDHTATLNNLNIIWANPLLFILAFYNPNKGNKLGRILSIIMAAILLLLLLNWFWLPQYLHYAVFPLVLALTIRSARFAIRWKR